MTQDPEAPTRGDLALLAFAALAWIVATAHFLWLGVAFAPTQAALFARIGVELPPYVRLAQVAPHQSSRWLPFFLAGPFVGLALTATLVRWWRHAWWSATSVRTFVVVALGGTSLAVLASFAIVQSTQAAYDRVVRDLYSQAP
ncbi:MAG: hypothetical protein ABW221_06725 [Vicinamibacteria bacterium]